jgi:hypothetical protein
MKSFDGRVEGSSTNGLGRLVLGELHTEVVNNAKVYALGGSKILIACDEWRRIYNTETGAVLTSGPAAHYDQIVYRAKGESMIVLGLKESRIELGVTKLVPSESSHGFVVTALSGIFGFARRETPEDAVPSKLRSRRSRPGVADATPFTVLKGTSLVLHDPVVYSTEESYLIICHDKYGFIIDPVSGEEIDIVTQKVTTKDCVYSGEGEHIFIIFEEAVSVRPGESLVQPKGSSHKYALTKSWERVAIGPRK